jgi:phosphoglycolate phosphatase-like HAD superfamily hydrolase
LIQPRALIFDFDGVILESVALKLGAAARLFAGDKERIPEVMAYWRENVSLSRYVKLRHIYRRILHRPLGPGEEAELGRRFGEDIAQAYRTCPKVDGAEELLEAYSGRRLLFVASGTPQDELRDVVEAQGLSGYFDGVFGSPTSKPDICARILERWGLGREEVVMVGDSPLDLEAARATGIGFIGRETASPGVFQSRGVPVVADLRGLRAMLEDWAAVASPVAPSAAGVAAAGQQREE